MSRRNLILELFAVLLLVAQILAHEGHKPIMGTVTVLDAKQIVVKTVDGKISSILLNKDTKYLRGKIAAAAAELKVGDRVVVVVKHAGNTLTASEIRLSSADKKKADVGIKNPAKSH